MRMNARKELERIDQTLSTMDHIIADPMHGPIPVAIALYVENVVREIQAEREIQNEMSAAVQNCVSNLRGAMLGMERLNAAMRLMANNASADEIRNVLRNPARGGDS